MTALTTLILARHGETQWNLKNKLQGHKNSPLTLNGRAQAERVKERIRHLEIHSAYVSPLERAVDTIEIILSERNLPAIKSSGLKEISLGPWEGRTKEQTKLSHPKEYDDFWHKQHLFSLAGAESFEQLQQRTVSELEAIIKNNPNKTTLVVSHWIAIKTALAYFTSTPLNQLSTLPDLKNGEYLTLIEEGDCVNVSGFRPQGLKL